MRTWGVRDGADRADVPYVWPGTLRLRARPPKLIYLDLNHWITLAKALAGHRNGTAQTGVLDSFLRAVEQRRAVFPISDSIYIEISKIRAYRQRRDLREVIEKLSGYLVVTARSVASSHEIEAMLDGIVGINPRPIKAVDYLDWGVARASGPPRRL